MNLERTVISLMQRLEKHFYGKYRGIVVDNEDPEDLGRLKVSVPSVLGTEVVTGWALPCATYGGALNQGMLFIPPLDSGVWIEFEEGDLEFPIWCGTYWSKPDGESELPLANDVEGAEIEIQNPVTSKIFKTSKGHTIQLEDKDDEEMVLIVQVNDDEKRNVISMTTDGITIWQKIDGETSNKIEMTESGMKLEDFTGNIVDMNDSEFTITSMVDFNINASGKIVEIIADTINLTKG